MAAARVAFVLLAAVAGAAAGLAVGASGAARSARTTTVHLRVDRFGRLRAFDVYYRDLVADRRELVRRVGFTCRAWNGELRTAYVLLPRWCAPGRNPRIPLVVSAHGRGIGARDNLRFRGGLPAGRPPWSLPRGRAAC